MADKNDIMIIRQVAEQAACFYFLLAKSAVCATICITLKNNGRLTEMVIEIDFNSDEAIYVPVSYTHLDVYKRQGMECG